MKMAKMDSRWVNTNDVNVILWICSRDVADYAGDVAFGSGRCKASKVVIKRKPCTQMKTGTWNLSCWREESYKTSNERWRETTSSLHANFRTSRGGLWWCVRVAGGIDAEKGKYILVLMGDWSAVVGDGRHVGGRKENEKLGLGQRNERGEKPI